MTNSRSSAVSPYMEWAKLHSAARFNLATSGMMSFPLADLGVTIDQLEINGPSIYGYEPLLQAIARRYRVPQESVVSAVGTSLANYLALAATTEPGDEILVEEPTYELIISTARYLGLELKRFPRRAENNFAIDPAEIERSITRRTRVIAICNLHNPTGAFTPDSTLREIGDLAGKVGAYVMVDEVYREMLFEREPQTSFHIDPERFIVTNSLTKAYGLSGLRCGWVLAAPDLAGRMFRINDLHGATFAHPAELLSVVAFGKLGQISARMKSLLDTNRRLLRDFLLSRDDLDYFWPEYGTIVFPRLKNGRVDELCRLLRDDFETSIVPGRFFETPDRFRIGVGGPTTEVRDALQQFSRGLDRYKDSIHSNAAARL
ncbi:MAG TPA: pyridoxal phosphate-dependent aminotransferase [Candidatus Angelobacter sp.]|nr:pyridoxal phosphate-dependent aminotransferase [Candidatus Angelobacter sp.]